MIYTSKRKTAPRPRNYAKFAKARSEIANLSANQLKDAGVDVSGIPFSPKFTADARTMTRPISLR